MKKMWIAAVLSLCVLASGCSAPHLSEEFHLADGSIPMPEITPAPTVVPETQESALMQPQQYVGDIVYQPERVPNALADQQDFSQGLYVMLADSIRAGADRVDLGEMQVTDAQFEVVRRALLNRNPWGTLSDIARGEGAQILLTYTLQDAQERTAQAQRFDETASYLLQSTVKPEYTQLSAALALYKMVAQTVQVDNEAEDTGLYGALVQGTATDYAMAYAYSFLLDQVGIDNVVITAEDGSHAWNVLTIGEMSFHCDVQMESGLNGGQALQGFGLSDADVARINGWNTWSSENSQLITCSESLMPELMQASCADVDAAGNAVYFAQLEGQSGVYRLDLSSGSVLQITDAPVRSVAVLGENLYYLTETGVLMCRDIQGGQEREALEGVAVENMSRRAAVLNYICQDGTEGSFSLE